MDLLEERMKEPRAFAMTGMMVAGVDLLRPRMVTAVTMP